MVVAFGFTAFVELLVRFAKPPPPGEDAIGVIELSVFVGLMTAAWFALLAFLMGDEVRFDELRVERRHPFRKTMRTAFADVDTLELRSSVRLQTRQLVASAANNKLVVDPDVLGFAPLARRFLERVRPQVITASRLRPFLLPLAQPGRFGFDARDRLGHAADGSEDDFDPQATVVGDDHGSA